MKRRHKLRADAALRRSQIIDLAEQGLTAKAISSRLALTTDTVYRHLSSSGVHAVTPVRKSPLWDVAKVQAAVKKLGARKAAAKFGVTRQAIYWRLAEARKAWSDA